MRTHSPRIASFTVILLSAAGAALAAGAATTRPTGDGSNTYRAVCLLKITYDPNVLPLNIEAVSRLISSAGVSTAAFRELFRNSATGPLFAGGEADVPFQISFRPFLAEKRPTASRPASPGQNEPLNVALLPDLGTAQPGVLFGELMVTLDSNLPPWAEEYLAAICDRLRTVLRKASESDVDYLRQQWEAERRDADGAESRMADLLKERLAMSVNARGGDPSREGMLETNRRLENEKQKLQMELAGQQARRKALQVAIAKIADEVARQMEKNSTLIDLEKAIQGIQDDMKAAERRLAESERSLAEAREKNAQSNEKRPEASAPNERERLEKQAQEHMVASKGVSVNMNKAAIDAVRQKLMEARLQMSQVREGVVRANGGDILGKLNGELATLAISTAETEARLKFIEERRSGLGDALQQADTYEMKIAIELPLAKRAFETARLRLAEQERRIRMVQPPNVTVLNGK